MCVSGFVLELQLDSATGAQKVSRALFLDSQQPALRLRLSLDPGANMSLSRKIYLRVRPSSPPAAVCFNQTNITLMFRAFIQSDEVHLSKEGETFITVGTVRMIIEPSSKHDLSLGYPCIQQR